MKDGRFVGRELVEFNEYEEYFSAYGPVRIYDSEKVYRGKPKAKIEKDITELLQKKKLAQQEITDMENAAADRMRETMTNFQKIKKYDALKDVVDLVEGKITHAVFYHDTEWKYCELEEYRKSFGARDDSKYYPGQFPLISLFSTNAKGSEWRVCQYLDGSGSWKTFHLCRSEEEAKQKVKDVLTDILATTKIVPNPHIYGDKKPWISPEALFAVNQAIKLSMDVPEELLKHRAEKLKTAAEAAIKVAKDEIARLKARLKELEVE